MAEQTWKVTGPNEYLGHAPGSIFEEDIPEEQAARAVEAGHISTSRATNLVETEPVKTEAALQAERDAITSASKTATSEELETPEEEDDEDPDDEDEEE